MDSQPSRSGRFGAESPANSSPKIGRSASSLSTSNSDASIQSLSSILNNPHAGKSDASWSGWWSSASNVTPPEFAPVSSTMAACEISLPDFEAYSRLISKSYNRFEDIRNHSSKQTGDLENIGGQGEALVACLREVPSLYFKEDFALEEGANFEVACPFSSLAENFVLQEKLSHYLDVVEVHLVKEISLRSNSFFEAQGQLQELNRKIMGGWSRIRELKETIRLLDVGLVDSARQIQQLNASRSNFFVLQQKLTFILYVNQALSDLKLLLNDNFLAECENGEVLDAHERSSLKVNGLRLVASADCTGALDVIDGLQNLLDGDDLAGLHCFRHLCDHVTNSIESINSILFAEFMFCAMRDAGDIDSVILSKAKVKAKTSILLNGKEDELKFGEEETSNFRDRLLPVIIGLLRTARLPSVLRIYRDAVIANMKTAIKNAVAELLPVLVSQPLESEFAPGERTTEADGGASLATKLKSLSSESFVQLLSAIFRIVQVHLVQASEVKKSIEWIMSNIGDNYAAGSIADAIALNVATTEAAQVNGRQDGSLQKGATKLPSLESTGIDALTPSKMSRNFRGDVLRENTEAVFAVCDAAHGRWAKLLGVRIQLHPKLRLQEFLTVYNITQEFITASEKIGGRLGYSIRGSLQSQAKAFVDFQHESRMAKIKAVLDQETWVEVEIPHEFQAIIASFSYSEESNSCDVDDIPGNTSTSYSEMVATNDGSHFVDGIVMVDSSKTSAGTFNQQELGERNKGDMKNLALQSSNNNSTLKERGKSTSQTLVYKGVSYHMVNCGLILLKSLSEYIETNNSLPVLSSEVFQRVVEILKFFNMRTCQLVLGAGAMQVSGLKSITSKHLALASQVISFIYDILPEIKCLLFQRVADTRKTLLLAEIDRVSQDYKIHRDEIHAKLVQIMRERLAVHLRGLPQIVETWNSPDESDAQPSQFARSLTKEVGFLQRVLSRTLHEADVHLIFRQVVIIFHSQISEAFSRLEISTPQSKDRLFRDVKHILGCIRLLPTNDIDKSGILNWGQLDEFLMQKSSDEMT